MNSVLNQLGRWGLLLALCVLPPTVWSQEPEPLPDRFKISVGAFFVTNAQTTLELAASVGPITAGTRVDFDSDLQLSDSEIVPRIDGYYRFTKRHGIDFTWFDIDRAGTAVTPFDIEFGDIFIPEGTPVNSFFNEELFKVSYGFSFYNVPKAELGILVGLHVTSIDVGIGSTAQKEQADTTVPLPVVGAFFRYQISNRWRFNGKSEIFALQLDKFKGSLTDLRLGVEHQTFKNVGFGFGFNRIATELEVDDGDFRGEFTNTLSGWQMYVFGAF